MTRSHLLAEYLLTMGLLALLCALFWAGVAWLGMRLWGWPEWVPVAVGVAVFPVAVLGLGVCMSSGN